MRSWIITSIVGYFIAASLCCFVQFTPEWTEYFWTVTLVFGVLSLAFNFKKEKSDWEILYIKMAVVYKCLCLLYYEIGQRNMDFKEWMPQNLFFLSSICFLVILGTLFRHFKPIKHISIDLNKRE